MSTFDAPERLATSRETFLQILLIVSSRLPNETALIPTSAVDVLVSHVYASRGTAVARLISELLSDEALAVA